MNFMKEWLLELILDSLESTEEGRKTRMTQKAELNKRLTNFINRRIKEPEENDGYPDLFAYVAENLRDELEICLFGRQEKSEKARETILLQGLAYVSDKYVSDKKEYSVKKAERLLRTVLDIGYEFIKEQIELISLEEGRENLSEEEGREELFIAEETVAGKTLLFRNIFLYKNGENQIIYLRAAALLKDGERNS